MIVRLRLSCRAKALPLSPASSLPITASLNSRLKDRRSSVDIGFSWSRTVPDFLVSRKGCTPGESLAASWRRQGQIQAPWRNPEILASKARALRRKSDPRRDGNARHGWTGGRFSFPLILTPIQHRGAARDGVFFGLPRAFPTPFLGFFSPPVPILRQLIRRGLRLDVPCVPADRRRGHRRLMRRDARYRRQRRGRRPGARRGLRPGTPDTSPIGRRDRRQLTRGALETSGRRGHPMVHAASTPLVRRRQRVFAKPCAEGLL